MTGPHLPPLRTREELFDQIVATTADYLRDTWPDELAQVTFRVAVLPPKVDGERGLDRWQVDAAARRVTLYRLPIERLARLHRNDDEHRRMMIEGCVYRAVGELIGRDPWDLAPDRFRHF